MASKPIGFRLEFELAEQLKRRAAIEEKSPGEYARKLVIDELNDVDRQLLQHKISVLEDSVAELKQMFRVATRGILTNCVSSYRPSEQEIEEIKEWVADNLD